MQPTTIPVDLNSWSRRDYFYYFTKMMPTGFNVNVDVDITATYDAVRAADYHFFPAYLYLVTKVIQGQPEFMMVMQDGRLAQFTELTPSYSLFHDDDHSISGMWTDYNSDFQVFYQNYLDDVTAYQHQQGAVGKPNQPENAYMINMMPWLHFNSYTPLVFNGLPNFLPTVEAGKYEIKNGWRIMPVSFTIHHAVADGYHVSRFFDRLQTAFDHPQKWLNLPVCR